MEKKSNFGQLLGTSTFLVFALSFSAFNIQAAEKSGSGYGTNLQSQPQAETVAADFNQVVRLPKKVALARVKGYSITIATESNDGQQEGTDQNTGNMPPKMPGAGMPPFGGKMGDGNMPTMGLRPGGDHEGQGEHGTSTDGFRQEKKNTVTLTDTEIACLMTALDTRDTAILSALDAYYATVKTAVTDRTTALKAAWSQTDRSARRAAIRKAWGDFRKAAMTARNTLRKAKLDAWKQWNTDRKTCAPSAPADDTANSSVDMNL